MKDKKNLQEILVITKDELIRLEKEYEKLDKAQLEKIKREKSAEFNELFEDFFLNIFMWMNPTNRQECYEDCEKVLQYVMDVEGKRNDSITGMGT